MRLPACLVVVVALSACARDASGPEREVRRPDAATPGSDAGKLTDSGSVNGGPDADDTGPEEAGPSPVSDACVGRCDAAASRSCEGEVAPGQSIAFDGVTVSAVKVGGGTNRVDVEPGSSIMLTASFVVAPSACTQLAFATSVRVGFEEGATGCSTPTPCVGGGDQELTVSLTAPTEPGSYGIYATAESNLNSVASCPQAFADPPPESARIATVCVE